MSDHDGASSFDASTVTGAWSLDRLPSGVVTAGLDCFLERLESFERISSVHRPALVLGDRVEVYTWTGFGIDEGGQMVVGDDSVLVGPQFLCAERITIGSRVVLSYNVSIADCDFHPHDLGTRRIDAQAISPQGDRRRPPLRTAPVRIDDDVHVGIGAVILKGVHVGAGSRVDAGAVVTADVPAGAVVAGNPGRVVG